jgi:hypothetical protein
LAGVVVAVGNLKEQRDVARRDAERKQQVEQRKVWQQRAADRAQRDGDDRCETAQLMRLQDSCLQAALEQLTQMLAGEESGAGGGGGGSSGGGIFASVPLLSDADAPQFVRVAAEVLFGCHYLGAGRIAVLPHTFGVEQLTAAGAAVLLDWLSRLAFTSPRWYCRHAVPDPMTWAGSEQAIEASKAGETLGCLWLEVERALASFFGEAFEFRGVRIGSGAQLAALSKAASALGLCLRPVWCFANGSGGEHPGEEWVRQSLSHADVQADGYHFMQPNKMWNSVERKLWASFRGMKPRAWADLHQSGEACAHTLWKTMQGAPFMQIFPDRHTFVLTNFPVAEGCFRAPPGNPFTGGAYRYRCGFLRGAHVIPLGNWMGKGNTYGPWGCSDAPKMRARLSQQRKDGKEGVKPAAELMVELSLQRQAVQLFERVCPMGGSAGRPRVRRSDEAIPLSERHVGGCDGAEQSELCGATLEHMVALAGVDPVVSNGRAVGAEDEPETLLDVCDSNRDNAFKTFEGGGDTDSMRRVLAETLKSTCDGPVAEAQMQREIRAFADIYVQLLRTKQTEPLQNARGRTALALHRLHPESVKDGFMETLSTSTAIELDLAQKERKRVVRAKANMGSMGRGWRVSLSLAGAACVVVVAFCGARIAFSLAALQFPAGSPWPALVAVLLFAGMVWQCGVQVPGSFGYDTADAQGRRLLLHDVFKAIFDLAGWPLPELQRLPVLQKLCNEQLCEWQARWILVRMREHFGRGRIAATALRAILDQLRSNGARLAPGSDAITLPFDSAEEAEAFLALPVDGYVPPGSKVGSRTASEALRDQRAYEEERERCTMDLSAFAVPGPLLLTTMAKAVVSEVDGAAAPKKRSSTGLGSKKLKVKTRGVAAAETQKHAAEPRSRARAPPSPDPDAGGGVGAAEVAAEAAAAAAEMLPSRRIPKLTKVADVHRVLKDDGYVQVRQRGHYTYRRELVPAAGKEGGSKLTQTFTVASTPSDARTVKNMRSDLNKQRRAAACFATAVEEEGEGEGDHDAADDDDGSNSGSDEEGAVHTVAEEAAGGADIALRGVAKAKAREAKKEALAKRRAAQREADGVRRRAALQRKQTEKRKAWAEEARRAMETTARLSAAAEAEEKEERSAAQARVAAEQRNRVAAERQAAAAVKEQQQEEKRQRWQRQQQQQQQRQRQREEEEARRLRQHEIELQREAEDDDKKEEEDDVDEDESKDARDGGAIMTELTADELLPELARMQTAGLAGTRAFNTLVDAHSRLMEQEARAAAAAAPKPSIAPRPAAARPVADRPAATAPTTPTAPTAPVRQPGLKYASVVRQDVAAAAAGFDAEVPWECKQCTFINAAGMALACDVCQCPRYA